MTGAICPRIDPQLDSVRKHRRSNPRRGLPRPAILRWTAAAVFALACAGRPTNASAQEFGDPAGDTVCDGPVIREIFVDNHAIYPPLPDSGQSANWARRLASWVANRVHRRTRPSLIRDELLFAEDDCFDPFLIEESGRILRALPFIADADVYPVTVSETEVHVVVDTRDKWTLKLDIRPEFDERVRITHASVTEENLLGTGTLFGFYLIELDERRDLGLELRTPRLGGTRADGRIGAGRTRTGRFFHESLTYPFVGEVGHWAFVELYSHREGPVPLRGSRRFGPYTCESPRADHPRGDDAGASFRYARRPDGGGRRGFLGGRFLR